KGRRPSWSGAASPEQAESQVDAVVSALRERGARVETGVFGADMTVQSAADGPFTVRVEVEPSEPCTGSVPLMPRDTAYIRPCRERIAVLRRCSGCPAELVSPSGYHRLARRTSATAWQQPHAGP